MYSFLDYHLKFFPPSPNTQYGAAKLYAPYEALSTPAAHKWKHIGLDIAERVNAYSLNDGSNQQNYFADTSGFVPGSPPLPMFQFGNPGPVQDPDIWQPLEVNGIVDSFITPHWFDVTPFSIDPTQKQMPEDDSQLFPSPPEDTNAIRPTFPYTSFRVPDKVRNSNGSYYDIPPITSVTDREGLIRSVEELIKVSGYLDPDKTEDADVSPAAVGNRDFDSHQYQDLGYASNPYTSASYAPNIANLGDYYRALAEFWLEEFDTPCGHAVHLADIYEPFYEEKRIAGEGPIVSDLEWDVKSYFAINAACHNAAIVSWAMKRKYQIVRPITLIRWMAERGQSSDPSAIRYHPLGLPLEDGLIELVTNETVAPGGRHVGLGPLAIGEIVVNTWRGFSNYPRFEYSGTGYIFAKEWNPYVFTPAFPAYCSGHSTYSSAAAETMTLFTGDPYVPTGLAEAVMDPGTLQVEFGPSKVTKIQWATYRDTAEQSGLSRLLSGVHWVQDDFAGRLLGWRVAQSSWPVLLRYFENK